MRALRSISALLLACLVLVSSTSFMVGIHRCGGRAQHIALFTEAESCPMEQQTPPCHRAVKSSCCEDVKVVHEQEDFSTPSASFEIALMPLDDAVVPSLIFAEVIPMQEPVVYLDYDPPVRTTDRIVALQVFLI